MANTYTQIHIQTVIAVRNRIALIQPNWEDRLYRYISGIIQNHEHKLLAINGMPDHVHIFFGMRPNQSISDLMRDVKSRSSQWINENKFTPGKFYWQEGYSAFSYAKAQVPNVIRYVRNQKNHHMKVNFQDEYIKLLKEFDINYDSKYLFKLPQ
jgi:putative transposase